MGSAIFFSHHHAEPGPVPVLRQPGRARGGRQPVGGAARHRAAQRRQSAAAAAAGRDLRVDGGRRGAGRRRSHGMDAVNSHT